MSPPDAAQGQCPASRPALSSLGWGINVFLSRKHRLVQSECSLSEMLFMAERKPLGTGG